MPPLKGCPILTGPHRCAEAQLAVVPDLSMFHDLDMLAADVDLAVSFLYIVSFGVEITTKTQLDAVQGTQGVFHGCNVCATFQHRRIKRLSAWTRASVSSKKVCEGRCNASQVHLGRSLLCQMRLHQPLAMRSSSAKCVRLSRGHVLLAGCRVSKGPKRL